MILNRVLLILLFGLFDFILISHFVFPLYADERKNHAQVQVALESQWVSPHQDSRVAIHFEIDKGWHTYFHNPGDSGLGTQVSLPEDSAFELSELQYPTPERINTGTLTSYGYRDEVTFLTKVRLKKNTTPESLLPLTLQLKWLICEEICIPEKKTITLNVPIKSGESPIDPLARGIFQAADLRFPKKIETENPVLAFLTDTSILLEFEPIPSLLSSIHPVDAIPITPAWVENPILPIFSKYQNRYRIRFSRKKNSPENLKEFEAILISKNTSFLIRSTQIHVAPPRDHNRFETLELPHPIVAPESSTPKLLTMILFAFMGGLLLNLMPCVFPILSLKALSISRSNPHSTNPKSFQIEAYGYTLGVLITCWTLSGILWVLRLNGENLGWGFQLQNSGFVLFLIALFFLMGFNLLGAFEVNLAGITSPLLKLTIQSKTHASNQTRSSWTGAIFTGALAVLVATPCTAPFMGVALGFALSQPVGIALGVFTSLGLGLASPFLVLGLFPKVASILPKPGTWMQTLKEILAFPLFSTVIWLLWVFSIQSGASGLIRALILLLILSFGIYLYGKKQKGEWKNKRWISVFLLVTTGLSISVFRSTILQEPALRETKQNSAWMPFDLESVEASLKAGKTVFVDFTAAWCITCQINKKTVLETKGVKEAFFQNDVHLYRADWTLEDPAITQVLSRLGRNGVPVYWVRKPGKPDQILPQILTSSIVIQSIER